MSDRYVVFPIGSSRYGLESGKVVELAWPEKVHAFAHTMRGIAGVLVRRGKVVPVCDLSNSLEPCADPKFYLIANCTSQGSQETVAIPVSGEFELVHGEAEVPDPEVTFVTGLLRDQRGTVKLLDLDSIVAHCVVVGEARQ